MSQDCIVCVEPVIQTELPCRHDVHLRCIALSGQNMCPVCRQPVQFDEVLQRLYEQRLQENQRELSQQQTQESVQLAHDLQREEMQTARRRMRDEDNIASLMINNRRFRVTITEDPDGPMDAGDLMIAINQVMMYTSERNRREFTASSNVLKLYSLIIELNRLSAETGLSVAQLCSVIELTQS